MVEGFQGKFPVESTWEPKPQEHCGVVIRNGTHSFSPATSRPPCPTQERRKICGMLLFSKRHRAVLGDGTEVLSIRRSASAELRPSKLDPFRIFFEMQGPSSWSPRRFLRRSPQKVSACSSRAFAGQILGRTRQPA